MIRGKVARILDKYRVVINVGSEDGVQEGDRFVIYDEVDAIEDPDTGEEIGELELPKANLEITHVQEQMSIGTHESEKTIDPVTVTSFLEKKKIQEKLPIDDDEDVPSRIQPEPIQVGDPVRSRE